jgi:hypothetical protein
MLIPLVLIGLIGGAAYAAKRHDKVPAKGVLTPERQVIFETALNEANAEQLRAMSKVFIEQGLVTEGRILEKRAKLRELSPEIKAARRQIYQDALKHTDPVYVDNLATVFEKEGATGAAQNLREYAAALRAQYGTGQAGVGPDGMPLGNAAAPIS